MQVTTHRAGLNTPNARLALARRIALAALAIFLMLNAVTPFITPDPPWLANLPLVIAIMAFLLVFRLSHIRAERARAAEAAKEQEKVTQRGAGARELWLISLPVPVCRSAGNVSGATPGTHDARIFEYASTVAFGKNFCVLMKTPGVLT